MFDLIGILLRILGYLKLPGLFHYVTRFIVLSCNAAWFMFCVAHLIRAYVKISSYIRIFFYVYMVAHVTFVRVCILKNEYVLTRLKERNRRLIRWTNGYLLIELISVFGVTVRTYVTQGTLRGDNLINSTYWIIAASICVMSYVFLIRLQEITNSMVVTAILKQEALRIAENWPCLANPPMIVFGTSERRFRSFKQEVKKMSIHQLRMKCRQAWEVRSQIEENLTNLIILMHIEYFAKNVTDVSVLIPRKIMCGRIELFDVLHNFGLAFSFFVMVVSGSAVHKSMLMIRKVVRRTLAFEECLELRLFMQSKLCYLSTPNWNGCFTFIGICWTFFVLVVQSVIPADLKC